MTAGIELPAFALAMIVLMVLFCFAVGGGLCSWSSTVPGKAMTTPSTAAAAGATPAKGSWSSPDLLAG